MYRMRNDFQSHRHPRQIKRDMHQPSHRRRTRVLFVRSRRYLETSGREASSFLFPYQRPSTPLVHLPRGAVIVAACVCQKLMSDVISILKQIHLCKHGNCYKASNCCVLLPKRERNASWSWGLKLVAIVQLVGRCALTRQLHNNSNTIGGCN